MQLAVRPSLARALGAGLAAAALLPAAAHAAPGWTAPRPLWPDPGIEQSAAIGFAGGGVETLAVASAQADGTSSLTVSAQPLGADRVTQLSLSESAGGGIAGPRVAVAPNGAAVMSWLAVAEGSAAVDIQLLAAYRGPDGTWGPPIVAMETGASALEPRAGVPVPTAEVAIGDDGTAAVVATYGEIDDVGEAQSDLRSDAIVHPPSGAWTAPARLSPVNRSAASASVAVSAAGAVTVAWDERADEGGSDAPFDDHHRTVARGWTPATGAWSAPQELVAAAVTTAAGIDVGIARDGETVVTTSRFGGTTAGLWTTRRPAGAGAFEAAQRPFERSALLLDAAVDPGGDVIALFGGAVSDDPMPGIGVVRAPRGGGSAMHVLRPTTTEAMTGAVATELAGGRTVLAWAVGDSSAASVQSTVWEPGAAAPSPVHQLATPSWSGPVDVVPDREGSAAILFPTVAGVRVAAFDAVGPRAVATSVPASATAGQAVQLSARFADRWSPPAGEPTWDFGDGRTATGTTVSHTFAAAGERTVTVRAADALGNETVERFAVRVAAGATPPPPPPRTGGRARAARPRVELAAPRCPKTLKKARCRRWRGSVAAWRVVRGTATGGVARVQVRVVRRGARPLVRRAVVKRGRWTVRLPRLAPGRATVRVRGLDARRRPVGKVVEKRLRLVLRAPAPRR